MLACRHNFVTLIPLLLQAGSTVNHHNLEYGNSPLDDVVRYGNLSIIQLLLQQKININAQDKRGWCSLHIACRMGNMDIIKLLLQHNADISIADHSGSTAMLEACSYGHIAVVTYLLSTKPYVEQIDLEHEDLQGETALFKAASNNHIDIVKLLLEKGANPAHVNKDLLSAADIADTKGYTAIVALLSKQTTNIVQSSTALTIPIITQIVSADSTLTVHFKAPNDPSIFSYKVICTPLISATELLSATPSTTIQPSTITGSGICSPIKIDGLSNGSSYVIKVIAGELESELSNAVTGTKHTLCRLSNANCTVII